MSPRSKWLTVMSLACVWIGLVVLRLFQDDPPKEIPLKYKSGIAHHRTMVMEDEEQSLIIQPLKRRLLPTATLPRKNIFASLYESPRHSLERKAVDRTVVVSSLAEQATPPQPQPSAAELAELEAQRLLEGKLKRVKDEMEQYRFLGFVSQNGEEKVFVGRGKEIFILRVGEILEKKFIVAGISNQTIRLREPETKIEATIKLLKETSGST